MNSFLSFFRAFLLVAVAALTPTAFAADSLQLFRTTGPIRGNALKPGSAEQMKARLEGRPLEGRVKRVEKDSFRALTKVSEKDHVQLPLVDGSLVDGVIEQIEHAGGFLRVAGALSGKDGGSFFLSMNAKAVSGLIQLPKRGLAYRVEQAAAEEFVLREMLREDVICTPMPKTRDAAPRAAAPVQAPPILSSRPQATAVLYMDFDGEVVRDPSWNNGVTINAAPARLTNAQITEAWQRVAEDYAPFNIDVTTDVARYNGAPVGKRMRCIITPTNTAAPGAGGVAYVNSFSQGGGQFTSNVPCWVFEDDNPKYCADATSHEFGHTVGLLHDGRNLPNGTREEYYLGHGSGAISWCPIMGAGYYTTVGQWSKGEYRYANNHEDDLAIIAKSANGFGYFPDEAGDSPQGAVPLTFSGTTVNQKGFITKQTDSDYFVFNTTGGTVTLTATGPSPNLGIANLDVVLEIQDVTGAVLASSNPATALNANITRALPAGDYLIKISGSGAGSPPDDGYTAYASIGAYTIGGTIPGGTSSSVPVIVSASAASGLRGVAFSYQILATGSPTGYAVTGTLPPGLNFAPTTGLISGTPTTSGNFPLTVSATNASGTGNRDLTITVNKGAVSIAEAVDAPAYVWVSGGDDEWAGVLDISFDGQDSAESAPIADGGTTFVETTVVGPGVVTFHWQVDSEAGGDFLHFSVDGIERAQISGNVPWQLQSATFPAGSHTLRWTYTKNGSLAQGLDKGWVDTVDVSLLPPPNITSPGTVLGEEGEVFSYQIEADNSPMSFGVTGTLPDGLTLDPATGLISGIPVGNGTTQVTISATNDAGTTTAPLTITISPPILTLAESVDAEQFAWTTFGQQSWSPETTITFDGLHAAQSGHIVDGQASTIEATVVGPTSLRFHWKVSSEVDCDFLEVSVDGIVQDRISGEVDWNERVVAVPSGTRKVRWQYRKDTSISAGADAAWLDQVTLDTAPQFIGSRQAVGKVGVAFVFRIGAVNTPSLYEATGLPPGLVLDPQTGLITGTPTQNGVFPVSVAVTNTNGTATDNFTVTIEPGVAGSDAFLASTVLEGAWVRLAANNTAATNETGEPLHGGQPGGHSVWWSWTAPSTGTAIVSTAGSGFNTTLAVYRGDSVTGLSLIGQNDNAGRATSSLVRFGAVAGQTYRIAVDGVSGATGNIVLSITYDDPASYTGLIRRITDGVLSGYASVKVTGSQKYTGTLYVDGYRYALRGQLDPEAPENHTLKGHKAPTLALSLSVNPRTGTDTVAGLVQGNSATYEFTLLRAMAPNDIAPNAAANYTAEIQTKSISPTLPGGIGYASFNLSRTGSVRMKGQLGDGQPFAAGGPIDLNSRLALFATPYKGGGSIGGLLEFDETATVPTAMGALEWEKKPDLKSRTYPAGFAKAAQFRGFRYQKPAAHAPVLSFGSGIVMFLGSDVAVAPAEQPVTISGSKITGGQFSASIDSGSGLWKGTFLAGGAKRSFSGALLPSENRGVGVFVGTQQTGSVTLAPPQ